MSPPSSETKSGRSKNTEESGGKSVKLIITSIPVNIMARRLEGNIGNYAVVASVTVGGADGNFTTRLLSVASV
jgi:hypothetical protein